MKLRINKPDGQILEFIEGDRYTFGDMLLRATEALERGWPFKWL
jgi:hypothetical protein